MAPPFVDCRVAASYDFAVFSSKSYLVVEFLRIGLVSWLYMISIFGWGHLICSRLLTSKLSLGDFGATRLVMGCLALYTAFVLLSALGWLHPTPVTVVLAVGLALGVWQVSAVRSKLVDALRRILKQPRGNRAILALVCVLILLQIVCGLTPLTFYDSQVYHLLAPVQFLKAGGLVRIPWNVLSNGPMALQLTLGMSWIADPSGNSFKLLSTVFGCLVVLAAARIGCQIGFRSAVFAALFVLAYPEFWIQQTFGAIDLAVAAFVLFGTVWWIAALNEQNWSWAALAAVAFGFVVGSRYQGVVLVSCILAAIFLIDCYVKRELSGRALMQCVAVAAVIAMMVSPWLLRNYLNFGNPVFPLMQQSLGGSEWSVGQAAQFQEAVMGTPLSRLAPSQMMLAPVAALLMTPSNGLFGLGLLLGSLMALSAGLGNVRIYAALGLGGLLIWGLIHPTPGVQLLRFNAASLVLILACTGAILGSDRFQGLKGGYIAATLVLGSLIIAIVSLHGIVPVWKTLTSSAARTEFWRTNVPSSRAIEFVNENLDAANDKILMIGETRALWVHVPFLAASAYNGPELLNVFQPTASVPEWTARLRHLRVTHVLICSSEWQRLADAYGYFRLSDDHLNRFNAWLHTLPVLFDDHHGNVVLALP
jgi:hypothetical protein